MYLMDALRGMELVVTTILPSAVGCCIALRSSRTCISGEPMITSSSSSFFSSDFLLTSTWIFSVQKTVLIKEICHIFVSMHSLFWGSSSGELKLSHRYLFWGDFIYLSIKHVIKRVHSYMWLTLCEGIFQWSVPLLIEVSTSPKSHTIFTLFLIVLCSNKPFISGNYQMNGTYQTSQPHLI